MEERLTQEQLVKIVGEVERLSQRRQEEVDRKQLEDILRELSLPPELLDDAMIQLQRREALAVQQRRTRWVMGGILAGLLVLMGTGFGLYQRQQGLLQQEQQALSRVSAQQDRITLTQAGATTLTTVSRQNTPELFYRVTLKDAPVSKRLPLSCDWISPTGQVVKQNRYQTREINTSTWDTHCRYQVESTSPAGKWQVRMFLDDRLLSDATFEVK